MKTVLLSILLFCVLLFPQLIYSNNSIHFPDKILNVNNIFSFALVAIYFFVEVYKSILKNKKVPEPEIDKLIEELRKNFDSIKDLPEDKIRILADGYRDAMDKILDMLNKSKRAHVFQWLITIIIVSILVYGISILNVTHDASRKTQVSETLCREKHPCPKEQKTNCRNDCNFIIGKNLGKQSDKIQNVINSYIKNGDLLADYGNQVLDKIRGICGKYPVTDNKYKACQRKQFVKDLISLSQNELPFHFDESITEDKYIRISIPGKNYRPKSGILGTCKCSPFYKQILKLQYIKKEAGKADELLQIQANADKNMHCKIGKESNYAYLYLNLEQMESLFGKKKFERDEFAYPKIFGTSGVIEIPSACKQSYYYKNDIYSRYYDEVKIIIE